jgi:hypothetical protein
MELRYPELPVEEMEPLLGDDLSFNAHRNGQSAKAGAPPVACNPKPRALVSAPLGVGDIPAGHSVDPGFPPVPITRLMFRWPQIIRTWSYCWRVCRKFATCSTRKLPVLELSESDRRAYEPEGNPDSDDLLPVSSPYFRHAPTVEPNGKI